MMHEFVTVRYLLMISVTIGFNTDQRHSASDYYWSGENAYKSAACVLHTCANWSGQFNKTPPRLCAHR